MRVGGIGGEGGSFADARPTTTQGPPAGPPQGTRGGLKEGQWWLGMGTGCCPCAVPGAAGSSCPWLKIVCCGCARWESRSRCSHVCVRGRSGAQSQSAVPVPSSFRPADCLPWPLQADRTMATRTQRQMSNNKQPRTITKEQEEKSAEDFLSEEAGRSPRSLRGGPAHTIDVCGRRVRRAPLGF